MAPAQRLAAIANQTRGGSQGMMKEAIVAKGPIVTIRDVPIPRAGPYQVVTKIIYSGCNPKDWKSPEFYEPINQGDDICGIVHEVGDHVSEFKPGDRVAAFHEMITPGGSFAEYGLSWSHTTFHLPNNISFEEGATIPLAAVTAAIGLFARLRLPNPWLPATTVTPLIVYGASSAVGSYVIQWAKRANIHPLICVAGRGAQHVWPMLDRKKGDTVIDYREGNDAVVRGFRNAAAQVGGKLEYAFDCISELPSYALISQVLAPHTGKITVVLPGKKYKEVPPTIQRTNTSIGSVHGVPDDLRDFGHVYFRYVAKGLEEGWFKPHPHEVVPGGLAGIQGALVNLKEGKNSATKYVFRIEDTPGLGGN